MHTVTEIPAQIDNIKANNTLRVAAYCRVSSDHEEQRTSLEAQISYYSQKIANTPGWTSAGIFAERGSGLRLWQRAEFMRMMDLARDGEVDLILTKSISRFGRNTVDMLQASLELCGCGVDAFFEKENIWLHDRQMQILLTAYMSYAQAESESMSQNIKWGISKGFQSGKSGYADFTCFGYRRGSDGNLEIDEPEADIVRKIFELRASGRSLNEISNWLFDEHIPSPTGKDQWNRETISKNLKNKKYTGDVMLQKTFVSNVFTGKQSRNIGQMDRYMIHEHHPAIVSKEMFERLNQRP